AHLGDSRASRLECGPAWSDLDDAGGPDVARPLGVPARRDDVVHAVDREQVDHHAALFAALAAADAQRLRPGDADAQFGQPPDYPVSGLRGPPGFVVSRGHVASSRRLAFESGALDDHRAPALTKKQ